MWNRRVLLRIAIALVLLAIYAGGILRNINGREDRSLELKDDAATPDRVAVNITVTSVDLVARTLTARIRFQPLGKIAGSTVSPIIPLKFYTNNAPGQQVFDFARAQLMARIEATFPLDGDLNRYPFDSYDVDILLFMTSPRAPKKNTAQSHQGDTPEVSPDLRDLDLAAAAQDTDTPVKLSISVSASVPGIKFAGKVTRNKELNTSNVVLNIRRPNNLISTSVFVMITMMVIAISVLAMVIKAMTTHEKHDFLPLSLCVTLMFSLPALRNVQPGVPPVGVLGDYFAFVWAEISVVAGAIFMTWKWVSARSEPQSTEETGGSETAPNPVAAGRNEEELTQTQEKKTGMK